MRIRTRSQPKSFFKEIKNCMCFTPPKLITTLESISKQINLEGIHFNKDYTPYSRQREETINKWCKKMNIDCCVYEDYLLASIGSFNKSDNTMYGVYGPFKNNVYNNRQLINKPQGTRVSLYSDKLSYQKLQFLHTVIKNP